MTVRDELQARALFGWPSGALWGWLPLSGTGGDGLPVRGREEV
ncbi:MAG TPA: hypothetical protein VFA46_04715 [Actinomycetes bacterium]|jgi:hypothetical protein|nr:hypothetical protein [Actinomycetes bacterium]